MQAYSDAFEVGEINRTFYKLPMVKTTERWRREAFDDFEFTLKTWQALTHPTSSPTWRKRKDKLTEKQEKNFGYLRPNREVIDAWEETKKRAEALKAKVCVIQTPGSFDCSKENEKNMRELLGKIDCGDLELAWEPRGDWKENPDKIEDICNDLGLIHIVDLMRREPVSDHPMSYIRLHGLNPSEYNYDYDYSDEELEELAEKLEGLAESHDVVYCMFNNYSMYENAQQLREII
ncbi:hypothetical protein AKJ42_00680 [candidate division MSBL1 archaeon SCGC-AAA261C02]|uniref:DUF72 domain-containing protein n=1 Tax=candidate division MSBL1 archaeon SCGC-AAA261C02 TaxID=1698272 RepID=A0A133V1X9_9EURY|nr:hypothetical protein AKJ42_00680 [candidate division MSBL1 archaeon SCGC-AAA261C02]